MKNSQLKVISQTFFLFRIKTINGIISQKSIKIKQKIEYGSNSDLPNFTNDVWSIDKTCGKKISFM